MTPKTYKRPESPYYWAAFRVGDKVHRTSTGCTDPTAALLALSKMVREAELLAQGVGPVEATEAPAKFSAAWEAWAKHLDAYGKIEQARTARHMVSAMDFAGKDTKEVTTVDIDDYIAASRMTVATGTVAKRASTLRQFFAFASYEWGIRNLGERIPKMPFTATRERRALTHDEARKLFAHPKRGKTWAFILFGGLRKSEAEAAQVSWIRGDTLHIPAQSAAKTHKARAVKYPRGFLSAWSGKPMSDKIVTCFLECELLRKDLVTMGVNPKHIDIHGLRRTVATWLADSSLLAARDHLGHASDATTRIYVKPENAHRVLEEMHASTGATP